jgi:hypothetical protein
VTLVLTLVLSAVALTALLWGLALFLQGYLYSQPAEQLPLRAAVGGLAVACMLTGWAYLNTRADRPDKYGVAIGLDRMMVSEEVRTVNEFEAVRRSAFRKGPDGKPEEKTVPYKWSEDGKGKFVDPGTNKDFRLNDTDSMTVALLVPDGDGKKARFDAQIENGRYVGEATAERRFDEQGGSRHIDGQNPRQMVVPSTGALAGAAAVNALSFVVWFLVFWPVLRFNVGHALGLTVVFGALTLAIVMPLLFDLNDVKRPTAGQVG